MTTPPYYRKLLSPPNDNNNNSNNTQSHTTSNHTTYRAHSETLSLHASLRIQEDRDDNNFTATCCYNSFKLNPPFDSAMALTVLILLTALFFMGFFSIYIRRFADESSVDPTHRRRRNAASEGEVGSAATYVSRLRNGVKGVDPTVVKSLPVFVFSNGRDVEEGGKKKSSDVAGDVVGDDVECAICLSEFEEREWVKEIPSCGHVFHVECIDTWLATHVTCPLCRTAEFFPTQNVKADVDEREGRKGNVLVEGHVAGGEEVGLGVREVHGNVESCSGGGEVRMVVDGRDTWREGDSEVGPRGVRRTSSCSWLGERVMLHRSLSF